MASDSYYVKLCKAVYLPVNYSDINTGYSSERREFSTSMTTMISCLTVVLVLSL